MADLPDATPDGAEMQRAEEIVDQAAQFASVWVTKIGHELLRNAARAREEAEDIWAEAQHLASQKRD
jgi:hypothetical protein